MYKYILCNVRHRVNVKISELVCVGETSSEDRRQETLMIKQWSKHNDTTHPDEAHESRASSACVCVYFSVYINPG